MSTPRSRSLIDVLEKDYVPVRGIVAGTENRYRHTLEVCARMLGRKRIGVKHLNAKVCGTILRRMEAKGYAPATVYLAASTLLSLAKFLHDEGQIEKVPHFRLPVVPEQSPVAWSYEELARLNRACSQARHYIGRVRSNVFWSALHQVAFETACRINELMQLEWTDIDFQTRIVIFRAETRKGQRAPHPEKLSPETIETLLKMKKHATHNVVFWIPFTFRTLQKRYVRLLKMAKLPADRDHGFHCLRRTGVTWFSHFGGMAQDMLGHADPKTAKRYLDPRFAFVNPDRPCDIVPKPGMAQEPLRVGAGSG